MFYAMILNSFVWLLILTSYNILKIIAHDKTLVIIYNTL